MWLSCIEERWSNQRPQKKFTGNPGTNTLETCSPAFPLWISKVQTHEFNTAEIARLELAAGWFGRRAFRFWGDGNLQCHLYARRSLPDRNVATADRVAGDWDCGFLRGRID